LGIRTNHIIQDDDNLYIDLAHSIPSGEKAGRLIRPREYDFEWGISTGISTGQACRFKDGISTISPHGDAFSSGAFIFTVADDATWPDFQPTPCATVRPEQRKSISSIMAWDGPPIAIAANNETKPNVSSSLRPGFGRCFMLLGLIEGLGRVVYRLAISVQLALDFVEMTPSKNRLAGADR
jgi:hypothetical protein